VGGDLMQVKPLGKRYHAGIDGLKSQRGVSGEQFSHPPIVVRGHFDDAEFIIGDAGAEFSGYRG
jgi:hypothetical protein